MITRFYTQIALIFLGLFILIKNSAEIIESFESGFKENPVATLLIPAIAILILISAIRRINKDYREFEEKKDKL